MKNIILFITFLLMARYSFGMMKALNIAATGMATQEMHVNTISNNVANLNTIGYKKQRAESEDLMYETITEAGSRSDANSNYTVGVQVGSGSKISGVRKVFSAGAPKVTNNPFDLMINGDGFFGIIKPNGQIVYTRDGAFNVNAQEWITDDNFESKINEKQAFGDNQNKPVIVEFYAKFNDANKFDQWQELADVIYYRADIATCPAAKKKYKVRMAPTLIIFKDGIKETVFKAGLDLMLPADLNEIQEAVDEVNTASQF